MHTFTIQTKKKQEIIEITDRVKEIVAESKVSDGICIVYVPHASATVMINENFDAALNEDILEKLEELIPSSGSYKHNKMDENAHSHIKSSIFGPSETIIITNGELQLGRWQGIAFCELDGPRERKVYVQIIKG